MNAPGPLGRARRGASYRGWTSLTAVGSAETGHTGVLHAGAQLSHRGWVVALTLAGAPRTDLFAQRPDRPGRLLAVQVKAEQGGGFFLGRELAEPEQTPEGIEEWFILVSLRDAEERPSFYVLPRAHIAAAVGTADKCFGGSYLQLGSKNFGDYRDAWDDLERGPRQAAWRLPRWHWGWRSDWEGADQVGMPPEPPADAPDV